MNADPAPSPATLNEPSREDAIALIWRNLSVRPSTLGPCRCGRAASRGGGPCLECAREALARHAGDDLAARFVTAVRVARRLEAEILEQSSLSTP